MSGFQSFPDSSESSDISSSSLPALGNISPSSSTCGGVADPVESVVIAPDPMTTSIGLELTMTIWSTVNSFNVRNSCPGKINSDLHILNHSKGQV